MEITADKDVHISSLSASQLFNGKQEVLLTCGGAYIRLKDGKIELHAPGKVSFKGGKHDWSGGASMNLTPPQFPNSICIPCLLKAMQSGSPFASKS
jgi:type VI secretion system secreted protein VgrG